MFFQWEITLFYDKIIKSDRGYVMKKLYDIGEYCAMGLLEDQSRGLFYRKALGLRRFYENCELPRYNNELLYPSGKIYSPSYLNGMAVNLDNIKKVSYEDAEKIEKAFLGYSSSVPAEHTVAGNMYTHSIPNYERILKEGLSSYITRTKKIDDADLREGLLHLISGIECYVKRCISYLKSVNADAKLIAALEKVPMHPAENIYEAVVCWNFILYLDNCDNLGCLASGLLPYYKGEDITSLLENLFDNLDKSDGYSMALGTDYNPLTLQCLKAASGKRRPMIELFVSDNTPKEIWDAALELTKSGGGQPAFYNPSVLLGGLQNKFKGISDEDIKKFCGGGCTESMIAGLSNVGSLDAGVNLLLILEGCIKSHLANSSSFAEFYDEYIRAVSAVVSHVTAEISKSQKRRAELNPLPMRTLLIDDCIEKGLDFNNGGARYKWSIINFAGIINVIDSLLVIRDLVFENKKYAPSLFIERLGDNDKAFLSELKRCHTCFGNDDPTANAFSNKLTSDIFSLLDNEKPYFGDGFLPASIQFCSQVSAGKRIGATPDGREAGAALCDSLGAVFGKDISGPTALLNSVAALDLKRALGVPILNFNVNPNFTDEILKSLILGYMKLGGIQVQITYISKQTLEAAYESPENYKNLVVRVGGYSEHFYKLSNELKQMVISRTIQDVK